MDSLMKAANASNIEKKVGNSIKESRINLIHFTNLIGRVYSSTCKYFEDVTDSNYIEKVDELMNNKEVMSLIERRGTVSDGDLVSLREALKWTALTVITGRKRKIFLCLIEPESMRDPKNIELQTKQSSLWNAFVVELSDDNVYTELSNCLHPRKRLNILSKSLLSYTVEL